MLITRYIFIQCAYSFILGTISLIGLVWLAQTLRLVELLVNKGALFIDFLTITLLAIPYWLLVILPISGLIATTGVMLKMKQDKEVIVMGAAGVSPMRIGLAGTAIGLCITLFLLVNSTFLMPYTYSQYKGYMTNLRASASIVIIQEGVFTDIAKGLTLYVDEREGGNVFRSIFIRDARQDDSVIELHASQASITLDSGIPQIVLYDGIRTEIHPGTTQAAVLEFDRYRLHLTTPANATPSRHQDYNEMSVVQLLTGEHLDPRFTREMRAEGHYRLSAPFLGISFILMAMAVILNTQLKRTQGWHQMAAVAGIAVAIEFILVTTRSASITNHNLFILMYLVVLAPGGLGLLMLANPPLASRMVVMLEALVGNAPQQPGRKRKKTAGKKGILRKRLA